MPIRTRRWNDPREPDDGLRLLVCRYRPRGLVKAKETWDLWLKELGPSAGLLADFHGKLRPAISWDEYERRFLSEMRAQERLLESLAKRVKAGETITLLCSSACADPSRCHRTLLERLLEARRRASPSPGGDTVASPNTAR